MLPADVMMTWLRNRNGADKPKYLFIYYYVIDANQIKHRRYVVKRGWETAIADPGTSKSVHDGRVQNAKPHSVWISFVYLAIAIDKTM